MNVTIDLKALFLIVIGIALLILIIYLISLIRKLFVSLEHANNIMENVETITDIAAKRSEDIDGMVENVSESVDSISQAIKGEQSLISALSAVVKAVAAVKNAATKE